MTHPLIVPLLLQIAGVAAIGAEIFVPSGGLLGVLATALLGYSLWTVFQTMPPAVLAAVIAADMIIIPAVVFTGLKLLARSPLTLHKSLSRAEGVTSQAPELERYLNREGVAATALRPSGAALIDGKRVDVVTRGEYLEKDSAIWVTSVTGNQIIVKSKAPPGRDEP